jgi:Cof subfamily protein (haloacid dehalogenase superfamily)
MEKILGDLMPIQLIATDLDETLLNKSAELTGRTIRALKRAMEAGVYVSLASGRMVKAMARYADAIGVNAPLIAFNGALTYDYRAKAALEAREVPTEDARLVALAAEARGVHVQAFTREDYFFERANAFSDLYARGIGGIGGKAVGEKLSGWIDAPLCKLLMVAEPPIAAQLVRELAPQFAGRMEIALSRPNYVECTASGVHKGAALSALAERLGIPRENVAAFGDNENDVSMIRWAGHGYAMANAPEGVRAGALSAPASDEDGVAQVIEGLLDGGAIVPSALL